MPIHTAKHICNSHKPTHNQKLQKSLSVSSADFADTKKLNLLKTEKNRMTELNNNLKPLTDKNAQLVTACLVHLAVSAKFEGDPSNKLFSGLTGSCFELPNDIILINIASF
jgi:hypothetical protein